MNPIKPVEDFKTEVTELLSKTLYDIPGINDIRSHYTVEQKLTACMSWVLTGSAQKASEISGLNALTIRKWRNEASWWPAAVHECKKVAYEALDYKFGQLISETVDQLSKRLTSGDKVFVPKTGQIVTVPIKARDLSQILNVIFDKRQLVRGDVTSRTEKINPEERLREVKRIAEEFGRGIEQTMSKVKEG